MRPDGSLKKKGDMLKLSKMADSLEKIANKPESFYSGPFAQDIADDIKDASKNGFKKILEHNNECTRIFSNQHKPITDIQTELLLKKIWKNMNPIERCL